MRLRFRIALTTLFAVVGVLTVGPATASASGPALAPVMTAAATYSATVTSSPGGSAASGPFAIVIVCSISVQNPHPSSHVGGTVNVIARTQCSAPVASLEMVMALARNGVIVGQATNANGGSSSLQNNVAVRCVSGTYQGAAEAGIVFPAGFVPPTGIIANVSALVPIKC
jgi:hypothetical protein